MSRDSIDGRGLEMVSSVHVARNWDNAMWDGKQMLYGDGGQFLQHLTGAIDVCAHELTHGVTQYTANLVYQAGTLSRGYDGLDNLTSETAPLGSIGSTYDAASRRQSMTVAGQPQVSYDYNEDNEVKTITQAGSSPVSFGYDAADRLTSLTLPNAVGRHAGGHRAGRRRSLVGRADSGAGEMAERSEIRLVVGERAWALRGVPQDIILDRHGRHRGHSRVRVRLRPSKQSQRCA